MDQRDRALARSRVPAGVTWTLRLRVDFMGISFPGEPEKVNCKTATSDKRSKRRRNEG
jgi:hypothetical protein